MTTITRDDIHLVVAIFLGSLIAVQAWDVSDVEPMQQVWGAEPTGIESVTGIAENLYTTWAMPFEVLSVLLLVALVGGLALAMREEEGGIV
jgi:NADH:ubiquinone oxidoreductase subunit 6 (subunit J)